MFLKKKRSVQKIEIVFKRFLNNKKIVNNINFEENDYSLKLIQIILI
jgi:hypothetical protein